MTMSALIVVRLAEMVLGLTANERFKAVQKLDSSGNFMTSKWFTAAMVAVLGGSVIALVVVGLYRKVAELKAAEDSFAGSSAKKGLNESEIELLMAIAVKAGLRNSDDIFNLGEAFETGAAGMLEESRLSGRATTETAVLEKQLAQLQAKLGYRKISDSAIKVQTRPNTIVTETETKNDISMGNGDVTETAFIALFAFTKKIEPADSGKQFPQFTPAKVIDVIGRILSIETTLPANVGDRVLVMIDSQNAGEAAEGRRLIEDIGVVRQSAQPAETIDSPNGRRLAIEMAGLSDAQAAQLAGIVAALKARRTSAVKEQGK